jgi:hypothetical protein
MNEDEYQEILRQAIRDRILSEVRQPKGFERIVNNVYGGPIAGEKNQGLGGGVVGEMGGMSPDDREYFVDIMREDLPEINPETGKPKGWRKSVRRYTKPAGSPMGEPEDGKKKTSKRSK